MTMMLSVLSGIAGREDCGVRRRGRKARHSYRAECIVLLEDEGFGKGQLMSRDPRTRGPGFCFLPSGRHLDSIVNGRNKQNAGCGFSE